MGAGKHDGLAVPGRVVLAHEIPFRIGEVGVDPPTRQLRRRERHETLEPRVMQVLVALYQAGGIVTRDELVARCWDGRVVGDDAINRIISRLRHIGADIGGGSFSIETITKVGYRLIAADAQPLDEQQPEPPAASAIDRRVLIGGTVALAALGLTGAAIFNRIPRNPPAPLPEAIALHDRAVAIRRDGWESENRQAMAYLQEAVRLSPEYGEAWGALALSYRSAINNEAPERVAGFEERLREAVRNAERYDPGNGDAAAALLPSKSIYGRWAELEPIYRSFVRRHPEHVAGYSLLSILLMDVGRWSDAVSVLQSAKARNLSSPGSQYRLIVSLWAAGRISAAEDEIDESMQLWPQHGAIWQTKIKLLALTGRPEEALRFAGDPAARPFEEREAPDMQGRLLLLTALATRSSPDVDRAMQAMLRRAREIEGDRVTIALYSATLGRIELALDMLEGVYLGSGEWALRATEPDRLVAHPLFQPYAQPLWREPRFNRILREIGLERYWSSTGTLPDYRRR